MLAGFPQTKSGWRDSDKGNTKNGVTYNNRPNDSTGKHHNDTGSAARFFYCAKASKAARNAGLEGMEAIAVHKITGRKEGSAGQMSPYAGITGKRAVKNTHPTVKPLSLMEYLCKLSATPTGGTVLDPFMGSGTTGMACKKTNREFIGIELDEHYFEIAEKRIASVIQVELL